MPLGRICGGTGGDPASSFLMGSDDPESLVTLEVTRVVILRREWRIDGTEEAGGGGGDAGDAEPPSLSSLSWRHTVSAIPPVRSLRQSRVVPYLSAS